MNSAVFQPADALTVDSVGGVLKTLLPAIARGEITALDLGQVRVADSAALALVLSCRRAARAAGRDLAVRGLSEDLAALAQLYGVSELIQGPAAQA